MLLDELIGNDLQGVVTQDPSHAACAIANPEAMLSAQESARSHGVELLVTI